MRKLRSKTKRWHVYATLLVAVTTGGLVAASTVRSSNSPTTITFKAVPANVLAADGIYLTLPDDAATAATSSRLQNPAEVAASKAFRGAAVRESHFAHCRFANIDEDCWAVSLDPSSVQSHGPVPMRATYLLTLVDPITQEVLVSEAGAPSP